MVSNGNECNHCPFVIDQIQEQPVTFIMDTICSSSTAETFETFGSFFLRTAYRKIKMVMNVITVFPMVMNVITVPLLLIRARNNLLLLSWIPYAVHPLQKHLKLLAVSFSGQLTER